MHIPTIKEPPGCVYASPDSETRFATVVPALAWLYNTMALWKIIGTASRRGDRYDLHNELIEPLSFSRLTDNKIPNEFNFRRIARSCQRLIILLC